MIFALVERVVVESNGWYVSLSRIVVVAGVVVVLIVDEGWRLIGAMMVENYYSDEVILVSRFLSPSPLSRSFLLFWSIATTVMRMMMMTGNRRTLSRHKIPFSRTSLGRTRFL
jgi:hypothetical protein